MGSLADERTSLLSDSDGDFTSLAYCADVPEKSLNYTKGAHRYDSPPPNTSVAVGILNLLNTMVGAGMLAISYGMAQMGYVLATIFLLLSGAASIFSMILLNKVSVWLANEHARDGTAPLERAHTSFTECAKKLYPKAVIIINIGVCVNGMGNMISYLIIMSDLMSKVFCFICPLSSDLVRSPQFWELVMLSVIIPVCWLKKLDSQKVSSLCANLSALMIVCVILSYPLWGEKVVHDSPKAFIFSIRFLNVFPTFVFAYTCQQNLFTVFNELRPEKRSRRLNYVIGTTNGIAICAYFAVGISGYFALGENISSNILNSYPDSIPMTIARFCLAVFMMFSYPIQFHPVRYYLNNLFFGSKPESWYPVSRHNGIGFATVFITFTVSFFVRKLDFVLGLIGATGSTLIVYILPGLFYYKAFSHRSLSQDKLRIFGFLFSCLGFVIMIVCVTFLIVNY